MNANLRLAEKFEYGGGKALPEEMTGPVMPIPSEARWKAAEEKRIDGVMRRRKGLPDVDDDDGGGGGTDSGGGHGGATTMFDQVNELIVITFAGQSTHFYVQDLTLDILTHRGKNQTPPFSNNAQTTHEDMIVHLTLPT